MQSPKLKSGKFAMKIPRWFGGETYHLILPSTTNVRTTWVPALFQLVSLLLKYLDSLAAKLTTLFYHQQQTLEPLGFQHFFNW